MKPAPNRICLGSARASRAGDRALAIANFDILLVSDAFDFRANLVGWRTY